MPALGKDATCKTCVFWSAPPQHSSPSQIGMCHHSIMILDGEMAHSWYCDKWMNQEMWDYKCNQHIGWAQFKREMDDVDNEIKSKLGIGPELEIVKDKPESEG